MTIDEPENDESGTEAESVEEKPQQESKWLRIRRSGLLRFDKIVHVCIRRRDEKFFLEIRADREIHLPVPDLPSAIRAIEALEAGASDISQWIVPRGFMTE